MRRTLSVLFGILVLFGFGCARHAAVTPSSNSSNPSQSQGTVPTPKEVKITIDIVTGVCVIIDPGDVVLSRKNQDRIKWCVEYKCAASGVMVIVDDFKDSKNTPVTKRNPFGNHSDRDNAFDFGPLDTNGRDCNKVTGLATVNGRYSYRILVLGADGSVLASLDPGVIIGD